MPRHVTPICAQMFINKRLGDQSRCSGGFVSPVGWENLCSLVISNQSVDSGLDQNESELGVFILAELLQMLSDDDSLLDQVVQILWDGWGKSVGLKDSHNLVSSHVLDLGDSVRVSKDDSDLRWGQTLSGEFAHMLRDFLWGNLQPRWRGSSVWKSRLGNSLTRTVHATHDYCSDSGRTRLQKTKHTHTQKKKRTTQERERERSKKNVRGTAPISALGASQQARHKKKNKECIRRSKTKGVEREARDAGITESVLFDRVEFLDFEVTEARSSESRLPCGSTCRGHGR